MARDPGGSILHLGDAALDFARGTLTRDGQVVHLRSKSFRLLCEMARQPGRVVPKGELLDAVWPDVIVTEASLSQAVRDVRKALNDGAGLMVLSDECELVSDWAGVPGVSQHRAAATRRERRYARPCRSCGW